MSLCHNWNFSLGETHDFHMQGFMIQGDIIENPTRIKEEIIEF